MFDQKCVKVVASGVWCKKEVAILLAESSLMEIGRFVYYAQLPWNPFAFDDCVGSCRRNFEIQVKCELLFGNKNRTIGKIYLLKKELKGHVLMMQMRVFKLLVWMPELFNSDFYRNQHSITVRWFENSSQKWKVLNFSW